MGELDHFLICLEMTKYITLLLWLSGMVFAYSQEPAKEKEINDLIDELFMEDDVIKELTAPLKNFQFLYILCNNVDFI